MAVPQGDFAENVNSGYGLTGDLSFRLIPSGWLDLRIDGGIIWYGLEEHRETAHAGGVPLDVKASTENYIIQGSIGPQLHLAGHPMSARLYGLLGMSLFETRTEVTLTDSDLEEYDRSLGSTGHLSDWTPSFTIGGGLRWTFFGTRDGYNAGLAFNLEWRRHGTTRYLTQGDITEVDGRSVFTPREGRADFLTASLGLWGGSW